MSPLVLLFGSLTYSLAFNVAWAWGTSPLSIGAAAACTLIVPAALHLWPRVPVHTTMHRVLRASVMTGICAAAAIVSFQHAVEVLLDNGWTDLSAWSVTGGAELLTTLSTMALRSPVRPAPPAKKATPKPAPKPEPKPEPKTPEQAEEKPAEPPAEPDEQEPTVGKRAAGLAWARENWPCSGGAIALAVSCSKAEGDRIRAMVKQEKEESA